MTAVNLEAMQAWVGALRSGAYRQDKGKLARKRTGEEGFGFCCLGVACDVYQVLHGDLGVEVIDLVDGSGEAISYDGNVDYLPDKVMEWLGVEDGNPYLLHVTNSNGYISRYSAANINDGEGPSDQGRTFDAIADLIANRYLVSGSDAE